MNKLVFATENPGKLREVRVFANNYDVEVLSPSEAGLVQVKVEETGNSYEENARLKVESCLGQEASKQLVICGDDSGMEIEALGGEPGIHTRRWNGSHMSDQEIIEYTLKKLSKETNRSVTARSVIAYSAFGSPIEYAQAVMKGHIIKVVDPSAPVQEGFPFERLAVVDGDPDIPLWKFGQLSISDRNGRLSHREQAFLKLFQYLNWTK